MAQNHHYQSNPCLPYISNTSPTEERPHFKSGSNVLSSIKGFIEKRPGHPAYTTDTFAQPVQRVFGWRVWSGAFFVMVNTVGGGQSIVYKLKVGTDATFVSLFTSAVATPFDFVVSNNQVYFGNGTDMQKYDGTTLTGWGIAKPAAVPVATQSAGAGSITASAGGYSYNYAFGNSTTGHIGQISGTSVATGNFTLKNYTITGSNTTDAQVNQIHIYRTMDGGATYYELPNSPIAYVNGWSVVDSALNSALNTSNQSSLPSMNAPPTAAKGSTFYAGRVWNYTGETLYYSNFEENINGIATEAFYNINKYTFGQEITGLAVCQKTLLVFTRSSIFKISGDSRSTFLRQTFKMRAGVDNIANIAVGGGNLVAWIDTTSTVWVTDGFTSQEIGMPIRTDVATFVQTSTSATFHYDGIRRWLILQDSSQNKSWVYDNDQGQWMIPWSIGGTAIHSCETSAGTYTLFRTLSTGFKVLSMNPTVYQDNGVSYSENLVTNLFNIASTDVGSVGTIEYLTIDRNNVPVSDILVLTDEDPSTGSFTSLFSAGVEIDPPDRTQGTGLVQKWYPIRGAASVGTAARFALKIAWPTSTSAWKLYNFDMITYRDEEIYADGKEGT